MVAYLSANIVCLEKRTKAKTVSFEEQIRDKYTRMFSSQMEASMFSIPQIYCFQCAGLLFSAFISNIFKNEISCSEDFFEVYNEEAQFFSPPK